MYKYMIVYTSKGIDFIFNKYFHTLEEMIEFIKELENKRGISILHKFEIKNLD